MSRLKLAAAGCESAESLFSTRSIRSFCSTGSIQSVGSVRTEGVNGTEVAASRCYFRWAAEISEINDRQRARKTLSDLRQRILC